MPKLVLLRHGESVWNALNVFTGWTDVPLSEEGELQAQRAGRLLAAHGYVFDAVYSSVLQRAIKTSWLALEAMDAMHTPEIKSWRLNERHYGGLQGLNKAQTAKKHGDEQVHIWRRSYDVPPPVLDLQDPRHPGHDIRYKNLSESELPATESLKDCIARCLPFWDSDIAPAISQGQTILIAAHGNSLRGIVKHLDNVSDMDIMNLEIPTGVPLVYELDESLKPLSHAYLGEELLRKLTPKIAVVSPGSDVIRRVLRAFVASGVTTKDKILGLPLSLLEPFTAPIGNMPDLVGDADTVGLQNLLAPGHGVTAATSVLQAETAKLLSLTDIVMWSPEGSPRGSVAATAADCVPPPGVVEGGPADLSASTPAAAPTVLDSAAESAAATVTTTTAAFKTSEDYALHLIEGNDPLLTALGQVLKTDKHLLVVFLPAYKGPEDIAAVEEGLADDGSQRIVVVDVAEGGLKALELGNRRIIALQPDEDGVRARVDGVQTEKAAGGKTPGVPMRVFAAGKATADDVARVVAMLSCACGQAVGTATVA